MERCTCRPLRILGGLCTRGAQTCIIARSLSLYLPLSHSFSLFLRRGAAFGPPTKRSLQDRELRLPGCCLRDGRAVRAEIEDWGEGGGGGAWDGMLGLGGVGGLSLLLLQPFLLSDGEKMKTKLEQVHPLEIMRTLGVI